MPYELRKKGNAIRTFETEEEAVEFATRAMQEDPDTEPEVFDTLSGQPIGPAASKKGRENLAGKVGF